MRHLELKLGARSLRALGLVSYLALSTLCGVAVHLVAEFAALGSRADATLIFSLRHVPLGLLALLALAILTASSAALGSGRCGAGAALRYAVPAGNARFTALAFVAQLVVFGATELGEGTPLGAGDVGLGLAAALLASMLGAYAATRVHARVVSALAVTFTFVCPTLRCHGHAAWYRVDAHVRIWRARAITFSASRRPPPALSAR